MGPGATKHLVRGVFLALITLLYASSMYAQLPAGMPEAAMPEAVQPEAQAPMDVFLYPELEPEPGKYIVPPVVDRPLGIDEGPKIKIQAFELRGAVDRPAQDLKVDDVWKIIEENRARHPQGLTIGQLQELANDLTNFYRGKGFIVAHAFIPVQTVEDGIVTIQVLEGVLGRVLVEGNKRYKPGPLAVPFQEMVGKPLTKGEVESALVRMGDYPGLTTFGVFQPGVNVGDSDLVLKVQEESGGDITFRLDNHGGQATGEYIAAMDFGINNMFGQGDRLVFTLQRSFDPSLSKFQSIEYSQMIVKPQYRIEAGSEDTNFDIADSGVGVTGLSGLSRRTYLQFRNTFERSRLKNSYWLVSINRKTAMTFQDDRRLARDKLSVLGFEYGFDSLDAETQGLNNFVFQYSHGEGNWLGSMDGYDDTDSSRRTSTGEFAGAKFDKFLISYTRLQTLTSTSSLLLRTNLQYTDDILLGLEQFALGGADSVRAYPGSQATMDRGLFISAEHIWNAPGFADKPSWFKNRKWGEVLTVSAFVEWAYGQKVDNLDNEDETESLKGWGIGTQLAIPGSFTAKLTAAWPIDDSPYPANDRRPQVFFNFEADLF